MARIEFSHIRLVDFLKSLHFPITAFRLLDTLRRKGYKVLVPYPPPVPRTHRVYVSGRIAEKNGCIIVIDSDKRFMGVEGTNLRTVKAIYEELSSLVTEEFGINMSDERDYLEFVCEGIIRTRKIAFKEIGRAFMDAKIVKKVSEILGEEVMTHTISFVPLDRMSSDKEWFEIRLLPHIGLPTREYEFTVVYRSPDCQKVRKFYEDVESKLLMIVEAIEAG